MTEYLKNSAEDDDVRQIIDEIEAAFEREADAKADAAETRKREVKAAKARAKQLGILLESLDAQLKVRKLERKILEVAEKVPEEQIEVFEEYNGQFSFLSPTDENAETAGQMALRRARDEEADGLDGGDDDFGDVDTGDDADAHDDDAEQAEGEEVLSGAVH